MDLNKPPEEDESSILVMLLKDGKQISQVSCSNTPVKISESLHIKDIIPAAYYPLKKLPQIVFHSASQNRFQHCEWQRFLKYLFEKDKVAVCQHGNCEFLIKPPGGQGLADWDHVDVAYRFEELPKDGEAGEFLVSADNRARESVLVRGEGVPKSHPPALHNKGSHLIVKSEDFRRPRVITEDACLRPQNSQSPSPRLVSCDATRAISRDYQEDSLVGIYPFKEQALYQTVYSWPDESMLAQGGRIPKPQTPALNRDLPQDGEAAAFLVSADNRTVESVLVRGERVPKSHIVKSEDFRRPRVVTENACLRPENSQSSSPRLVSGDASCIISRDYREDRLDNCHPAKEQAFYQTIYSLPSETMLAQGESRSRPQTAALHRQQSQVVVKSEKSEDFTRARAGTEDACLGAQNSQSLSPGFVSDDATCTVSRDCQEFSLHNLHPAKEQALYEKIYSLPRAPINFKEYMYNSSAQMPLETPHGSLREDEQEISATDRIIVTPEYMNTVRHMHNGWPFGALAELIDNARDANASKLDISIQMEFNKSAGQKIPILSVTDNGRGMSHLDLVRMLSLGHEHPTEYNRDHIGCFGVGFKAGSMQLGKDVVVLTQCTETRSIAFLSRSYNENNKELVVPIITYRKEGGWMDFDLQVHSKAKAEAHLESIKKYSPFNEYTIGSKFASFAENGTGTHIYIYNLARWGANYTLAWDENGDDERDLKKKRDIWIRSRCVRGREGQVSREVPLDYSLHSYLEVIFLNPRMKIYVQGTMVRTHPLARSLNKTKVVRDVLLGKNVELTLGRSQEEKERGNCGMFLYWHGRLIEAYKRVGGMVQSADMGRGVIGVMDVTDLMKVENEVMVLPTKQGFAHSEALHLLVQWLGCKADEYWDENFDTLELDMHGLESNLQDVLKHGMYYDLHECDNGLTFYMYAFHLSQFIYHILKNEFWRVNNAVKRYRTARDNSKRYKPDHEWVQCNKCRKWRILDPCFNADLLPPEWFCFMPPFKGLCDIPEQKAEQGIITVSTNRSSGGISNAWQSRSVEEMNVTSLDDSIISSTSNKGESEISTDTEDEPVVELHVAKRTLKRLRRGPPPSKGVAKRSRVK